MKPVIYLDVDGVLNALHWRDQAPDHWDDFERHPSVMPDPDLHPEEAYSLWLSKKMVAEIAALDADVKWLTTWRHSAANVIAPLVDAPEWEVVDWQRSKAVAMVADQKEQCRPFVWIDDDVADPRYLPVFCEDTIHPEHLFVMPDPRKGLTPEELKEIQDWIKKLP